MAPFLRRRADLLRRHDHERGFAIGAILFILTMVGVGGAVLYSGYSQILRTNIEITRDNAAKNDLLAAARTLSATSAMINGGLNIQPPAVLPFASADSARLPGGYANAGATGAPIAVGVMQAAAGTRQLDPWNHYYIYCRWENASSPGTDPALMLISAGPDGVLNTGCGDVVAQNDDRIERLSVAQAVDRANVWQYQPTTSGAQVQFGITGNAVQVTNQGDISANSLTLAGPLNADALTLTTPLAVSQGGTGASDAATARTNLGSGTAGDAVFTAATTAGARGALGSTTVGDAVFTAANADSGRSALGATAFGSSLFTTADYSSALDLLGAQTTGKALFLSEDVDDALAILQSGNPVGRSVFKAATATTARSALGAGTVGDAMFTAGTGAVARAAIGAGATGDAVFAAANPNTALTALGLIGGSATLDIGITGTANTAVYLADGGNILAGAVPVTRGGTGAGDAATARSNLGADNADNLTSGTLSWTRLPASGAVGNYNWGAVNAYGIVTAANNVAVNAVLGNAGGGTGSNVTITAGSGFGYDNDGGDVNITGGDGGNGYLGGSVNITGGQDSSGTNGSINLLAYQAGAINLSGDSNFILAGGGDTSAVSIKGSSAKTRFLAFTTADTKRWEMGADNTAESGSNAGSNFVIRNYSDAGTQIGTPFSIERATGNVTINGTVTATTFVGGGAGGALNLGASAAATNPSRSSEAGTGLFSPATGVVAVANNGAESLRVAANGNVGIGTTNSDVRLEVFGTGWSDATGAEARITNSNLAGAGLTLKATGTGGASYSLLSTATSAGIGAGGFGLYDHAMAAYRLALPLGGGLRIPANAGTDIFTTPVGTLVATKINIPLFDPGAFGQILIAGLPATANATARAMSFVDARTAAHQPTLGVFSPDENQIMGFTYDGSNTAGYVSSTVALGFKVNATTEAMHIAASGNVGIGTSNPSADAILDLGSSTSSLLLPVGTTAQRPTGEQGMLRYNTTVADTGVEYFNGSTWNKLTTGNIVTALDGLTDAATDYTTDHNMFMGSGAGASIAAGGQYNLGVGEYALFALTDGDNNTALGYGALALNTTGYNNIAIGQLALRNVWSGSNNTGYSNIAIGTNALGGITSEIANTVIGHGAAVYSYGSGMTIIGASALGDNSNHRASDGSTIVGAGSWPSGSFNAIVGAGAGSFAGASGNANSGVGYQVLYNATSAANNAALGLSALAAATTGSNNVGIGSGVGSTTLATGSNNILIGTSSAVDTPAAGTSNWINLGNQLVSDWSVTGSEAIGLNRNTTGTPGTTALIVGTGANNGNGATLTAAGVWTNASDARIKEAIQPLGYGLDTVMRLRPVAYQMKGTQEKQIGFIAQEVERVMPEVVVRPGDLNDPTQHYTLAYGNMVAATVKAIQELKTENDNLRTAMVASHPHTSSEQAEAGSRSAVGMILAGGIIVLLLGLGGLGMMVFRLRREVRRLQKVA